MGVKGRRKRDLQDEPTLLKDVQSIIDNAIEKGFVKDYEVDIERIVENEGIILEKDFEMESSKSGSLSKDKKQDKWVIKVNGKHHVKRQRFTIAHEFAHYCLHKDEQGSFVDEEIYFRKDHESSIEYNADVFASEILMPKVLFDKAIKEDNIKKIKELSDKFNVSTMAITIRAEKLGFKTKSHEK
ncbi:ImmA/IrrE family metallo-endopeptidase [uncultured Desulfobacter sp.]|uniref:ImmA/IrrE family metallo-endopeptidase n=1 Tax=uncultured Desulfobacter sp. TaxID=240139 RepID=UPI002AA923B6|nr:ImmA/IrrE family metallo-endopeptidase [uncultured Desulfobacter sp.]